MIGRWIERPDLSPR